MKIIILYLLGCMLVIAAGDDWYSHWNSAGKTWHEKWSNTLNTIDELPFPDRIEMLGKAVECSAGGSNGSEKSDIFTRAQSTLLAIPGHAKYFQDKIESLRAQVLVDSKKPQDEINRLRAAGTYVEYVEYGDFRRNAFGVLALLQSSETVAVLGHFLNDPEGRDGRDLLGRERGGSDYLPFPPNCGAAYIAISNLGIANPPTRVAVPDRNSYLYDLANVDAWKIWWNEVKVGKRTYHFIGSPIEYGPDGPVSTTRQMRQEKPRPSTGESTSDPTRSPTVPWMVAILATCVACVVAAWCIVRMKSRRV